MLSGFPPVGGPLKLLTGAGPLRLLDFTRLLPASLGRPRQAAVRGRRLARLAARRRAARRRAAGRRRLGDRRLLPEPARARGRLAEPARRRGAAHRRARLLLGALGGEIRTGARVERSPRGGRPRVRRRDRRRARSGADGGRRRDAVGAAADDRRPARLVPTALKRFVAGRGDDQGRLGARRPDPVGERRGRRRRHGARRRRRGRLPALGQAGPRRPRRPARSCCSASRASPTRRARPRASTPPGPTPTARRRASTGSTATPRVVERMEEQVERFAPGFRDRILARHVLCSRRPRGPQREPGRRRRRRRQLPAAPGRLPPGPEALALQHAAEGPLHRQRRDVPRRRRPRRARRRRRQSRPQVLTRPCSSA